MKLIGYSERGMIWTLFGELARHSDAGQLLAELLGCTTFVGGGTENSMPIDATSILVEQSFSGFGDADVVLLLDHGTRKRCVFIEAKVSCFDKAWTVRKELVKFENAQAGGHAVFSNLLVQLAAKERLVRAMRDGDDLQPGVTFLKHFSSRKIGRNSVVQRAVETLRPYVADASYVALLPNDRGFAEAVAGFAAINATECPIESKRWGVLTWPRVRALCELRGLTRTVDAFDHNRGQIYDETSSAIA